MAKQIWKYEIPPTSFEAGGGIVHVQRGAKLLSVALQNEKATVWAMVDPKADKEAWRFHLAPTGHDLDFAFASHKFISTLQYANGLVFHVFHAEFL